MERKTATGDLSLSILKTAKLLISLFCPLDFKKSKWTHYTLLRKVVSPGGFGLVDKAGALPTAKGMDMWTMGYAHRGRASHGLWIG